MGGAALHPADVWNNVARLADQSRYCAQQLEDLARAARTCCGVGAWGTPKQDAEAGDCLIRSPEPGGPWLLQVLQFWRR